MTNQGLILRDDLKCILNSITNVDSKEKNMFGNMWQNTTSI